MSPFAFVVLAVQACLLQSVYGQCIGAPWPGPAIAPAAWQFGAPGLAAAAPVAIAVGPAYGGAGIGEIAVAGELPACGTTVVVGQVPVLGGVEYASVVPASGTVTISGSCGCGCGAPFLY